MYIDKLNVELIAITPNAESVIEKAARTCHNSKEQDLSIIEKCIRKKHFSVLEHANATFRISGISRACSHQFVRHRIVSISQRSQRYVEEDDFGIIVPPLIMQNEKTYECFMKQMKEAERTYWGLRAKGIKKEDARFVLPNAASTELVFTANFRELRHIIELRTAKDAQWEIIRMCIDILNILMGMTIYSFRDMYYKEIEPKSMNLIFGRGGNENK